MQSPPKVMSKLVQWIPFFVGLLIVLLLAVYATKYLSQFNVPWIFHFEGQPSPAWYSITIPKRMFDGMHSPMVFATILVMFLLSFFFRRSLDNISQGVVAAFLASFLIEMYGIAYSLYLVYSLLDQPTTPTEFPAGSPMRGSIFDGMQRHPAILIGYPIGLVLIWLGWKRIHAGGGKLVTGGIYRVMRHPQYLGLLIIGLGVLVFCPTFMQLILFIVLVLMYIRVAILEDRKMEALFGDEYRAWRARVGFFWPRWRAASQPSGRGPAAPGQGPAA